MIILNTQQLETFIYVAENLSFARAAELLNITQSAVSRQIHSLEDELGARLLHRTTRTVTLTPEGLSFLEDAKHIMTRLKLAASRIQHHSDSKMQVLSIGCVNEAHPDFLRRILEACREQIPAFHPFLRIISHRSHLNLFYQGEIELLFGFKDDIQLRGEVVYKELAKIPLCCLVPEKHPLASYKEIDVQDLMTENLITCSSWVIPVKAAEFQNQITSRLSPESIHICDNLQIILTLIRSGYGYSILPGSRNSDAGLHYIPLKNAEPLSYGIFCKKGSSDPLLKKVTTIAKSCSVLS